MNKFIIRFASEITLKGRLERNRLIDILINDILKRSMALNIKVRLQRNFSHLQLVADSKIDFLYDIFGISSIFEVLDEVTGDIDKLSDRVCTLFKDVVFEKKFRVRIKKSSKKCEYTSNELACRIGSVLLPFAKKVDLKNPEVEVRVEYIDGIYNLGLGRVKGAGGLPLASQGRVLVLCSGGFDSVVASFLLMKRGLRCDFLLCNLAYDSYRAQVFEIIKKLTDKFSPNDTKFISVNFDSIVNELKLKIKPRYRQVVLKRLMYMVSNLVSKKVGVKVIATGESIGQVSSQTLGNLSIINKASDVMVLRPLISMDKSDIINLSYRLGVGKLCEKIVERCDLVKGKVSIKPSLATILDEEKKFDFRLLGRCCDGMEIFNLGKQLKPSNIYVDKLDQTFDVIDCQPESGFSKCHLKLARHIELDDIISNIKNFSVDKKYMFYCYEGFLSTIAVEVLRRSGLEVYAFEGGLKKLRAKYPDKVSVL